MRAHLDGTVALVTGASSGIGQAIAVQLAPRVKALVLVARRVDRLEALKKDLAAKHPSLAVLVKACDVTDFAAVDAMLTAVEAEAGPVDVLVNNAGMGDFGTFDRVRWDKTRRMIDLNVTSLCYLTHRLLPPMVARGRGAVLNVSSGMGMFFLPGFSAYAGTKHFVTAFTEALRLDLRGTGVVVSQVCPGPVATEFEELAADFAAPKVPTILEITAERCARDALRGLTRGRALVVPGVLMRIVMAVGVMMPRFLLRWMYAPAATQLRRLQAGAASKGG